MAMCMPGRSGAVWPELGVVVVRGLEHIGTSQGGSWPWFSATEGSLDTGLSCWLKPPPLAIQVRQPWQKDSPQ